MDNVKVELYMAQVKADRLQEELHIAKEKLNTSRQETQALRQIVYLCGSTLTNVSLSGTKMVEELSEDEEIDERNMTCDTTSFF